MKVTVNEAAEKLGCSKANIYQQLKAHRIETKTEMRRVEYETTKSVRKQVFELDDLVKAKGVPIEDLRK